MPRVMIKGGIPVLAIKTPESSPKRAPTKSPMRIAGTRGILPSTTNLVTRAPHTPAVEPTVRSIPPVIMANAMPQARIP